MDVVIAALIASFVLIGGRADIKFDTQSVAPGGPVCHNYNNIGCK